MPPSAIHADLVELAGGADRIAERARQQLGRGRPLHALRLLDLAADSPTRLVLDTRIAVLERLLDQARPLDNYSEIGLLQAELRKAHEARGRMGG